MSFCFVTTFGQNLLVVDCHFWCDMKKMTPKKKKLHMVGLLLVWMHLKNNPTSNDRCNTMTLIHINYVIIVSFEFDRIFQAFNQNLPFHNPFYNCIRFTTIIKPSFCGPFAIQVSTFDTFLFFFFCKGIQFLFPNNVQKKGCN